MFMHVMCVMMYLSCVECLHQWTVYASPCIVIFFVVKILRIAGSQHISTKCDTE